MSEKLPIKIVPSLLSADFGHLADEAIRAEDAGADSLQIDVMDGHFVQNLTMGPDVVAAVNRATELPLDVHLMIYNPYSYIERFVEAGADSITIHFEATEEVADTLAFIRRCNTKAGLAFCPETSTEFVTKYLDQTDLILMMTVNPGFGGQPFMPEVLDKIAHVRSILDRLDIREGGQLATDGESLPPFDIQVDGGIDDTTAQQCYDAGANSLVSGSYLFGQSDMAAAIQSLRACAD